MAGGRRPALGRGGGEIGSPDGWGEAVCAPAEPEAARETASLPGVDGSLRRVVALRGPRLPTDGDGALMLGPFDPGSPREATVGARSPK